MTNGEKRNKVKDDMDRRFLQEVNDANILLDWAVATGKGKDEETEFEELVQDINEGYAYLTNGKEAQPDRRAAFSKAYGKLARLLRQEQLKKVKPGEPIPSPVTAETLKATSDECGRKTLLAPYRYFFGGQGILSRVRDLVRRKPPAEDAQAAQLVSKARRWSRKLWILTFLLLIGVLIGANLEKFRQTFYATDSLSNQENSQFEIITYWIDLVVPFLYGALGACAYLIRSCHLYIHKRTFDPSRIPEYINRIFLGLLAGGTIMLFVTPESTLIGGETKIEGPALAFLAGYSTDFLYTALERIANAVLPKGTTAS